MVAAAAAPRGGGCRRLSVARVAARSTAAAAPRTVPAPTTVAPCRRSTAEETWTGVAPAGGRQLPRSRFAAAPPSPSPPPSSSSETSTAASSRPLAAPEAAAGGSS